MGENDIYATAFKLLTLGYSVIPSGGGESGKAPLVDWGEYQDRPPTEDQLQEWEETLHPKLWGIVTGKVSDVIVLDADNDDARAIFENAGHATHITTPRGGGHFWFKHPGYPVKTCAGILPGLDVRGDGGFVNVVGSRHDGEYQTVILPTPDSVYPFEDIPAVVKDAMLNGQRTSANPTEKAPNWITEAMKGVAKGERDHTCTKLAGYFLEKLPPDIVKTMLYDFAAKCEQPPGHPFTNQDVDRIVESVENKRLRTSGVTNTGDIKNTSIYCPSVVESNAERDKSVTETVTESLPQRIEDWIKESNGWFSYEEIDKEFGIRDTSVKDNRRQILHRLKDAGIIESHPKKSGLFRYVNVAVRLIDFKSATKRTPLKLRYPFGIEGYFNTYPGNIIVLAGAADSGKTGFLLNLIRMNQSDFSIFYQSSEMGKEELASRLDKFEGISLDEWNFVAEERSSNFADVVRPDCINIIDYMELSSDFYNVAEYLRQIHDKLASGIAVVALQKKRGADLGRGGDFGLEKPRLYLSMDKGKITIQKAKNWVNPEDNPNGLTLGFKIVGGCKFIITEDWHRTKE